MNKLDLIQTLVTTNGLSKSEATRIVSIFFEQMAAALENGDRVDIPLGPFSFHGICPTLVPPLFEADH